MTADGEEVSELFITRIQCALFSMFSLHIAYVLFAFHSSVMLFRILYNM